MNELDEKKLWLENVEGQLYALQSLRTEWIKIKDNYGNEGYYIPLYEVERIAKKLAGQRRFLKQELSAPLQTSRKARK